MQKGLDKVEKIKISELFYYIFFGALLFAKGIGLYDGQAMFKVLLVIALAAWTGKMLLTKYTVKEFIVVSGLVLLGGITYLVSGEKGALLYILMITGLKNVPVKRVFKVGAVIWCSSFLIMCLLNATHFIEGPFKVHEKFGMGMVIRWGLGYSHPNVLHVSYLAFVMFLVYLMDQKFNWKSAVGFMIGNMIVFIYSLSSTGVIIVAFYLCLAVYWRYRGKFNKAEKILIQLVFPVCVGFSLAAPLLLKGKAFDIVNDIMNTRLFLSRAFLSLHSFTLFGVRLSEVTTSQFTMDNSYVFSFVIYGMVLFVVMGCAYLILVHKYCKEEKGKELSIILTCFAGGVMEPFLFNTSFKNLSLIFMKDIIFEEEKQESLCFLSKFDKDMNLHFEKGYDMGKCFSAAWEQKKKLVCIVSLVSMLVGAVAYEIVVQQPERIIVPEKNCDVAVIQNTRENLEFVYLESKTEVPQENDKVVGYTNKDTSMIVYEDGIVKMEHLRGVVCSSIVMAIVLGVGTIMINLRKRV